MNRNLAFLCILLFIFAFCLSGNGVYAFGAGNIPSFAYMEGRAFRHGDIEDALAQLIKKGSGGGFALASLISKGSKFNGLDIKRVYFGNWLRDYSQAVDIAGLKKLQIQAIINLCMALGFMAHGYATHEFEVTEERLGVYLPVEHIDNPKGYGEGEDARKYHPKLRGPVDPVELHIDPRSGMKNYIANENGHWDTSKRLVRRTLEQCIHLGRLHRSQDRKQDLYEAYRLLGTALHTLEDFPAHSNFCELALVSLGNSEVFTHVGDQARVQAPNGKWVAPLVTGTFGGSDFMHSLLGEATDHISSASVSDLNKELDKARSVQTRSGGPGGKTPGDNLREMFFTLPGGGGSEMSREMDSIERIRAGPAQGGKRPEDMSPQELHAVLWQVLVWRDSVVKKISKTIEKIPGLNSLIESLMDSISVFVFTTLEPFLKPIIKTATTGLMSASSEVINTVDQYEVFNDPHASDPTHSFLSKDHFNLILNEPAGQLARVILIYTVNLVIKAWDDASVNVNQVTEEVLQCMFHPDFHNSQSKIQREMLQHMRTWLDGLPKRQETLRRLNKQSVRNHENIRLAGDGGAPASQGSYAANQGIQAQASIQGYVNQIPGVAQAQSLFGGGQQGGRRDIPGSGYPGAAAHAQPQSQYGGGPPAMPGMPHSQSSPPFAGGGGGGGGPPQSPHFPGSPHSPPGGGYAPPHSPPGGGYAPSYAPSYNSPAPPSFPGGGGPSFPGSSSGPGFPSGGPPSFPGGPGRGYGGEPGAYLPPPGPGGYGAPEGYPPPVGGPPGFPGDDSMYGGGQGHQPRFPGAPGDGPGFPSSNTGGGYPSYGGGGGW